MSNVNPDTGKTIEQIPTLEEWTAAGYLPSVYEERFANSEAPPAIPMTVPDPIPHPASGGVMGNNGLWVFPTDPSVVPVVAEESLETVDEEAKEDNRILSPDGKFVYDNGNWVPFDEAPSVNTNLDTPPARTVPSTMVAKNG